jgi:hypothetical protein
MAPNETGTGADKQHDEKIPIKKQNVPNKITEALMLPSCMNLNPRSIYNKLKEFSTLITEEQIHCVFLSESWERPEFDLTKLIDIEDFSVISNPHQRKGMGGRPALIINTKHYKDVTCVETFLLCKSFSTKFAT